MGSGFISSFKNVHKLMFVKVSTVTTGELHTCHRTLGGCHRLASPWSSLHVFYEGVCMHGCERGWLSAAKCFSFCEKIDVALEIMFKNSGARWGKGYLLLHSKDVCEYTDFTLCIPFSAVVFKECYCRFSSTSVSVFRVCDPLCLSLSEAWHRILT